MPFSALHSLADTPHCWAAAAIRRARALAPACCKYSREARTARLPPVAMRWYTRFWRRLRLAEAYWRTFCPVT